MNKVITTGYCLWYAHEPLLLSTDAHINCSQHHCRAVAQAPSGEKQSIYFLEHASGHPTCPALLAGCSPMGSGHTRAQAGVITLRSK